MSTEPTLQANPWTKAPPANKRVVGPVPVTNRKKSARIGASVGTIGWLAVPWGASSMTSTRPFAPRTPPPAVAIPGRMMAVAPLDPPVAEPETPETDQAPESGPPRRPFWKRVLVPLALWLIAIGLGVLVATLFFTRQDTATPAQVDEAINEALAATTVPPDRGPAIYGTIIQSVVFIQVGEPGATTGSIGTGVIINADGTIMTSNHVVDSGEPITVTFIDGTRSAAQIVESRPELDIATIAATTLPQVVVPAVLGGTVPIGAEVYAVGNPLGLGGSFSEGVVSGLERSLPLDDGTQLNDLIQFDAAVNPGSSGGPLVNANAQVVGIVTALVNPTGSDFFAGIGFAVPIETAGGAAGGPEQ